MGEIPEVLDAAVKLNNLLNNIQVKEESLIEKQMINKLDNFLTKQLWTELSVYFENQYVEPFHELL